MLPLPAFRPFSARLPWALRVSLRVSLLSGLLCLGLCFGSTSLAAADAANQTENALRFDRAYTLVKSHYWDAGLNKVNWQELRRTFRPQALKARSEAQLYEVLEHLYDALNDQHTTFLPPSKAEKFRHRFGDLPCLAYFGQTLRLSDTASKELPEIRMQGHSHLRYGLDAKNKIAVVLLPDLAEPGIAQDMRRVVTALEARGAKGFILDLRGNPGGRLIEMMQVAGIFTKGFLWRTITRWTLPIPYPAVGNPVTEKPLAVLIDGGVNSAAEGLSGALQLTGRAKIFGQRSAGNVEAVLPFCLDDGSQAWIATGVLAPMGGPTWEGRGVIPDVTTKRPMRAAIAFLQEETTGVTAP